MKKILFSVLCGLAAVSAGGVNPQYQKFMNLKYRDNCDNFDPGEFQSISGKFNGKTTDTLTLFPFDGSRDGDGYFYYDKWVVISKNGTVPSKIVSSYYPELVYEGDLDGNGTDEFGVLLTGQNGTWWTYEAFTVYNGKVQSFAETQWWGGDEEPLSIIMSRGAKRGEVIIRSYGWTSDMSEIVMKKATRRITKFMR